MGKYAFIKTANIVPVAKKLELEYQENYTAEVKKLVVNVWPYTLEEKLELQNLNESIKKETNPDLSTQYMNDLVYKSVFYVLKKDDPEVTIEDVKKFPDAWLSRIPTKALEWEGITEEVIKEQEKKAIDEKLKLAQ